MRIALLLASVTIAACSTRSPSSGNDAGPGSDGQPCIDNNTCNPGLVCITTSSAAGPSAWTCESEVACPPFYFDASTETWAAAHEACANGMPPNGYEGACGGFLVLSQCGVDSCGVSLFDADSGALVATLGAGEEYDCIAGDRVIPASCFFGPANAIRCATPEGGADADGGE
jgi:hypothetical protein